MQMLLYDIHYYLKHEFMSDMDPVVLSIILCCDVIDSGCTIKSYGTSQLVLRREGIVKLGSYFLLENHKTNSSSGS